jgi:hypothetical protein
LAGLYNVVRDDTDVQMLAQAAACEEQGARCTAKKTGWERDPIGESFVMLNGRGEALHVRCSREYFVLGEYACALRDRLPYGGGPVAVPRPVAPAAGKVGAARKPAASGSAAAPVAPGDGGP